MNSVQISWTTMICMLIMSEHVLGHHRDIWTSLSAPSYV